MQRLVVATVFFALAGVFVVGAVQAIEITKVDLPANQVQAIERAAPDQAAVKPAKPRKILVYGRVPTHPESVPCCFKALEILGKKTGAFEAVSSGDPAAFLPENHGQFDAVVMNNTHEGTPMLPWNFKDLDKDQQAAAKQREPLCKKGLLEFVSGGKGLAGIHGATCSVQWPEYLELIGGSYGGHITEKVWVKPEDPRHPLCAALEGESFEIHDEIYVFKAPYARQNVRVLLGLDMVKTRDPGKREDKDYAVSWVRSYGKGRVFYCSLGHVLGAYTNPQVLRHYLAGIQFAIGDLPAETASLPLAR
jgi:uncharacterized protein